jgi:hypothetical protein
MPDYKENDERSFSCEKDFVVFKDKPQMSEQKKGGIGEI